MCRVFAHWMNEVERNNRINERNDEKKNMFKIAKKEQNFYSFHFTLEFHVIFFIRDTKSHHIVYSFRYSECVNEESWSFFFVLHWIERKIYTKLNLNCLRSFSVFALNRVKDSAWTMCLCSRYIFSFLYFSYEYFQFPVPTPLNLILFRIVFTFIICILYTIIFKARSHCILRWMYWLVFWLFASEFL